MITKYSNYIKENKTVDSYFLQTYEETKDWLDSVNIINYTINDDLTVDVNQTVNINGFILDKIPVQFNIVKGSFSCSYNNLTNLKGCPKYIHKNFFAENNPLKDITDLDSKILIKSFEDNRIWIEGIYTRTYDEYFEYWINKDIDIINVLKDRVSIFIIEKYKHLFNAKNFDLL